MTVMGCLLLLVLLLVTMLTMVVLVLTVVMTIWMMVAMVTVVVAIMAMEQFFCNALPVTLTDHHALISHQVRNQSINPACGHGEKLIVVIDTGHLHIGDIRALTP